MTTLPTPAELETLQKLALAQNGRLYGPVDHMRPNDIYNAYKTLPKEHLSALQKKGLWYTLSATQGNVTEAGCEALKETIAAAREQACKQAVVDTLIADAQKLGLVAVRNEPAPIDSNMAVKVTTQAGIALEMGLADLALFLVEERLVQNGTIC